MVPPDSNLSDHFAERLRFWRTSQKLTQAEAARQLDIDRSYFSQVERGRVPGNALRRRFLQLEKSSWIKNNGHVAAFGLRNLPVLSWTEAGDLIEIRESTREGYETVPSDVADERAFGIRLRGDSMEPKFSDGDIAILLPGTPPVNGDVVVANLKGQGVFCKIMHVQLNKDLIKFSSYNPAYPPTEHRRDEFHWIFPVASIIKQLRRK